MNSVFTNAHWRDYLEGCFPEWVACFALLIAWRVKLFEIPTVIETWANEPWVLSSLP